MQTSLSMSIFKTMNCCAPEMKVTNVLAWGSRGEKVERRMEIKNFCLLPLSVHDESDFILSMF